MAKKSFGKYILLGVLLLAVLGFILSSIPKSPKKATNIDVSSKTERNISFRKEGTMIISKMGGDSVTTIDIELADTQEERAQGMMYRQSLGGLQGMLFLFDETRPQSFWMKNTYVPLDIIFLDEENRIVDMYQNAEPKSEKSIRSRRPARNVLEVNAGFCRAYNIGPGMRCEFIPD